MSVTLRCKRPLLIVFSGLPGTGKTTISKALAAKMRAVYLRIDAIEQAMRSAGAAPIGPAGYAVANALATANAPAPLKPDGGATRVEIDLGRQVLFLYTNGSLA